MQQKNNRCNLCKYCHIEPKEEITELQDKDISKPITMWYHCEITDMPTDNTHCLNCVSFKEKSDNNKI